MGAPWVLVPTVLVPTDEPTSRIALRRVDNVTETGTRAGPGCGVGDRVRAGRIRPAPQWLSTREGGGGDSAGLWASGAGPVSGDPVGAHSGDRAVDPIVLVETTTAVPEARAVVLAVTTAMDEGNRAVAAETVVGHLTAARNPVRYPARATALMSVLLPLAARVIRDTEPTRSGMVLSLPAPPGADATQHREPGRHG